MEAVRGGGGAGTPINCLGPYSDLPVHHRTSSPISSGAPVYEQGRTHHLYRDAVVRRLVLTAYVPTAADDGNCTALPATGCCD